jgi:hypothetical protein
LIRSSGDLNLAAQKIDNSRVTRGGLATVVGQAAPALLTALQYEQEIEFMGQGVDPFFNRRRSGYNAPAAGGRPAYVDGLITNTPRHMPVPAKELDILLRAVYTFGGPSSPDMSAAVEGGVKRETVEQRFRALENARPGYLTRFLPSDMRF